VRAVVLRAHGGPEVLTLEAVPDPEPGPDEVLVDIETTAVNRADLLQRMGFYPNPALEELEIPGLELAGTVAATGRRATLWQPGDRVMGIVSGGAYAERIAVHERQLMAAPARLGPAAGAVPEVYLTAWDALVVQGGLTVSRWALVHAGASGVGTAAIQIAKAVGARIAVTCSAGKMGVCRDLGADLVLERSPHDWLADAKAAVPAGFDVVLDVVGGDEVDRNLDAVAYRGRILQVGTMASGPSAANVGKLMPKRASLIGTVLRARPLEEKIALTRRFATEMLPLFETGQLVPVIDSRYPLDQIAAAHERMGANANVGKILIEVAQAR
jgi:putative PIG3 family NAD(P)H quinone oxidoreductase